MRESDRGILSPFEAEREQTPNRPDDPEYIVRLRGKIINCEFEVGGGVKELAPINRES